MHVTVEIKRVLETEKTIQQNARKEEKQPKNPVGKKNRIIGVTLLIHKLVNDRSCFGVAELEDCRSHAQPL